MKRGGIGFRMHSVLLLALAAFPVLCSAQTLSNERAFPQSKAVVEKGLKEVQASASGRLPTLDGFAVPGDIPLDRFQRGYYQCRVQVSTQSSGGSLVKVNAKITAWYDAPSSAQSGYQVLPSNGRLESDLLDRLNEILGGQSGSISTAGRPKSEPEKQKKKENSNSTIAAGSVPDAPSTASSGEIFRANKSPEKEAPSLATQKAVTDRHIEALKTEAKNLEEILHNQSHPRNLAAVKKANTPVLANPAEGGKVLFLAAAEDEFEMLDMNASWVHVRISGLSRGWIRRSAVELSGEPVADVPAEVSAPPAAKPSQASRFQVEHEEIASFPATWEPLKGKTVKIVSVQPTGATSAGSQEKLDFAKSVFEQQYAELTQAPTTAVGVVVIFDSADGGMLATTLPVLRQWKAGDLSDEALWRRCYVDPPEMFSGSGKQ